MEKFPAGGLFFQETLKSLQNRPILIVTTSNPRKEDDIMRIEAYTQVQQMYKTKKPVKTQTAKNVSFSDQLQISSIGKDIQTAKAAVAGSSDIREDVTAPIKARIKEGSYEVSAESFADKLFSKYEEMR